jgi:hypothetical protein
MAKDSDNLVLRLLRDIRGKLDDHGKKLDHLDKRVGDLYKISTHTLGVAVNAHARQEELEKKVDSLTRRVARLEARQ